MRGHNVHFIKGLGAIGTLSHPVRNAVLYTVVAEEVSASFQYSVFEVLSTDGAKGKSLKINISVEAHT